jgi:hypothetical protein
MKPTAKRVINPTFTVVFIFFLWRALRTPISKIPLGTETLQKNGFFVVLCGQWHGRLSLAGGIEKRTKRVLIGSRAGSGNGENKFLKNNMASPLFCVGS